MEFDATLIDPTTSIVEAIRSREDELVSLTQDLVRIPTVNPPGDGYIEICDYLENRFKKRSFSVERVRAIGARGDSDRYPRWNIIARHEGARSGECVHFNSHTDVVATGSGWTVDPFQALVKDRRIYGRGTCDMKGGMAASIIAAETFIDLYPGYAGAVEISGTCDEESGGFGGVAYLAEHGWFNPDRVQHVIIPEPLNKDRICLGHRGVWWAELETFGHIAHGSMPFQGDCAIRHMNAVLQLFEDKLFPLLASKHTTMPIVPEGAKQSTMNINSIHGGLDEPESDYTGLPAALVPDSCRLVLDRRFLIEENLPDVESEVRNLLEELKSVRPNFEFELNTLFSVLPTMTDQQAPVVKAVHNAVASHLGKNPDYVISPGTYDQKHIDRIGRLHNCIAYGPGILDLAHQPDEYIDIDDMLDSAIVMVESIASMLVGKVDN